MINWLYPKMYLGTTRLLCCALNNLSCIGTLVLSISLAEQNSTMEENIIQHHVVIADVASQSIEAGYIARRWPFRTLEEVSKCESVLFWWIVKPDGEILLADDAAMWQKHVDDRSLGTDKIIVKDSVFYKTGENIKLIVHPLKIEDGKQWTFYMGVSLEPIVAVRNEMILSGVGILVAISFVAFLVSVYFGKSITRPISELTEGARAISQGNLDYEIKVKSEDEIGKLADVFNKMTVDLKKSRAELESYSTNLEKEVGKRTAELEKANKELKNEIIERKKAEERIKKQNIQLKKLNRIKSDFINVTSHELRTPITGIKGYVQMLLKQSLGEISKEQKSALEVVLRNSNRLDHLVQDVLDISQLQSGTMRFTPEPTDVGKMVDEAVEAMQSSADLKKIKINVNIEDNIPDLIIDKECIKKAIIHLVDNAIKFSPDGSIVNIRAKNERDHVLFEVHDFGRGIPKNKEKKVFETFYQVDSGMDRVFGGVGLGLTISQGIVVAHGGKIWVEGTVNEGSTFRFTLPIKPKQDIEGRFEGVDMFRLKNNEQDTENIVFDRKNFRM